MKKKSTLKSAFFNPRILIAFVLCLFGVGLSLFAAGILQGNAAVSSKSGGAAAGPVSNNQVIVIQSVKNDVSPPVREVPFAAINLFRLPCELKENPETGIPHKDAPDGALGDPALALRSLRNSHIPSTILNFEGIDFPGVVCSCAPPDTDGAVGLNQYVQEVNEGFQVFNKSSGVSELGPISVSSIWTGFGGVCQNSGEGDVVVLYDHFANRWLISQFAATGAVVSDECVAISTSPDATGSYYRYDFPLGPNYYDYPKIAIWPDGYYQSNNVFNAAGTSFLGPQAFAFNRTAMLQGLPATAIAPNGNGGLGSTVGSMLPADIDGMTLPPSGAPETYIGFPTAGSYTIYHFHVDFGTPANSTWTTFATPAAAAFTQLCTAGTMPRACVPQSGVTTVNQRPGRDRRPVHVPRRLSQRHCGLPWG